MRSDGASTARQDSEAAELLRRVLRAGDLVTWGQGAGEPLRLTRALVTGRHELPTFRVLLGMSLSDTIGPADADSLSITVLGGFGTNRRLTREGQVEVLAAHMSAVPKLIRDGSLPVDVALINVSPADHDGMHHLGAGADHVLAALDVARVVVAEINPAMPRTRGDTRVPASRIHYVIHGDLDLLCSSSATATESDPVADAVARNVAELVPDRATIQLGVGTIPGAVARALRGKRDIGIHTGLLTDDILDLIECGAATGTAKPVDPGIAVGVLLVGGRRLFEFSDNNAQIELRSSDYVYAADTMSRLPLFFAINSALQVDLTGQLNSEVLGDSYIGAVGGQADFMRGAAASPGGRTIVALTSARGSSSNIVTTLDQALVTTTRSDVDAVVTEWGTAWLRGRTTRERTTALIAIAHPDHRTELIARARQKRLTAPPLVRPTPDAEL